MKRRVYLFLILFLTIFMMNNKVKADMMYLQCNYEGANTFVLLTKDNGTTYFKVMNPDMDSFNSVSTTCWINDLKNIDSDCDKENDLATTDDYFSSNIVSGVCPAGTRKSKNIGDTTRVVAGFGSSKEYSTIEKSDYVMYRYTAPFDENIKIIGLEGYYKDGTFAYFNSPGLNGYSIEGFQTLSIIKNGAKFWQIAENFNSLSFGYWMNCTDYSDCYNYEVIIDSKSNNEERKKIVKDWYDAEAESYKSANEAFSEVIADTEFINICKNIDNAVSSSKEYNLPSGYSALTFLDKLSSAYNNIKTAYNSKFNDYFGEEKSETNDPSQSILSYFYSTIVPEGEKAALKYLKIDGYDALNEELIDKMLLESFTSDLSEINPDVSSVDIMNKDESLNEYLRLFLVAISYADKNYKGMLKTNDDKLRLETLRANFEAFAREKNIYAIIDCKGLLGQDLIDKINSYLNIIKVAIPIILIGFGIVDFAGAVFASDEDKMKKAQKKFISRLIVCILIFLTPTFLNMILRLANEVWPIIVPDNCGIGF